MNPWSGTLFPAEYQSLFGPYILSLNPEDNWMIIFPEKRRKTLEIVKNGCIMEERDIKLSRIDWENIYEKEKHHGEKGARVC